MRGEFTAVLGFWFHLNGMGVDDGDMDVKLDRTRMSMNGGT
jgi:hypothetical protein